MHQLSSQDAQFLYMETAHNLAHVTSISVYDPGTVPGGGVVRFKDILAHVERRLAANPLLTRRLLRLPLELDYPYWIEDEFFDLEYHVTHGRLPEPGDWRQFCIHMARYHSRSLDMRRPPWEMYVVEGLDHIDGLSAGCYAIATKIHHAAGDGASLTRFFASLSDIDPQGTPAIPLQPVESGSDPMPAFGTLARRALVNNLRSPLRLGSAFLRTVPGLLETARDAARGKDGSAPPPRYPVPHTRFNVAVSPHKVFDARVVPLADLQAARALVPGATVNDVILAVCSDALRRYLQRHDELPDDSLVAWVPINARARAGADADGDAAGNRISAMTAPIFTNEADSVERLRRISQSTRRSKEARAGVPARLMTDLTQHVPAATQVLASRLVLQTGLAARLCNVFISNVPGPQIPLYMNGACAVRNFGLAPLADGMGLFIATPSYNGRVSFNVISTREIVPDIDVLMVCFDEALDAMREALRTAPESGRRTTTARRAKTPAKRRKTPARARKTTPERRRAARKRASPDAKPD